jgi:hypothetical protein
MEKTKKMEIDTLDEFTSVRKLFTLADKLSMASADSADSEFIEEFGDDFKECDWCYNLAMDCGGRCRGRSYYDEDREEEKEYDKYKHLDSKDDEIPDPNI